ncbi:MAG: AtpZ/AtpI family protein, partial [Clostridiales bacterium]|nr:AtpZ/AtpI family protein [Clostridiales bacterium]
MKKNQMSVLQNLAVLSQVGIMMIVPIIGGVFIGDWLDR